MSVVYLQVIVTYAKKIVGTIDIVCFSGFLSNDRLNNREKREPLAVLLDKEQLALDLDGAELLAQGHLLRLLPHHHQRAHVLLLKGLLARLRAFLGLSFESRSAATVLRLSVAV